MPVTRNYSITPIEGNIYLAKLSSGRIWLFRSNRDKESLTYHDACYCIDSNGSSYYDNRLYTTKGRLCEDSKVVYIREANRNEIAMFNNRMSER